MRFGTVNEKTYINRMTAKRFEKVIKEENPFKTKLYKLVPLKKSLSFLVKLLVKECSSEWLFM